MYLPTLSMHVCDQSINFRPDNHVSIESIDVGIALFHNPAFSASGGVGHCPIKEVLVWLQ